MHIYKAYPGGKHKILTLSYDDGKFADRRLIEIFNRYNIKATFNLNSGIVDDIRIPADEWKSLYEGHEIATHSMTHPTIDRCSNSEIIYELLQDRINLEKIFEKPILGHAFPNGSTSPRVQQIMKDVGIKYGRTINDSYSNVKATEAAKASEKNYIPVVGEISGFEFPENFLNWNPTCHHNHDLLGYAKKFLELKKTQYIYLFYVWGHSYEFDRDNNWELMEEFCKMISNQDDIWYATNIEIVEYEEMYSRLVFAADNHFVYNPNYKSVWMVVNETEVVEVKPGETKFF